MNDKKRMQIQKRLTSTKPVVVRFAVSADQYGRVTLRPLEADVPLYAAYLETIKAKTTTKAI